MLYVGDADFSTDIAGNSLESAVALAIRYSSLLAIDNVNNDHTGLQGARGVSYWKVGNISKSILHYPDRMLQSFGYALVAEIAGTNAIFAVTKVSPVHVDVRFTVKLPVCEADVSVVECGRRSASFASGC